MGVNETLTFAVEGIIAIFIFIIFFTALAPSVIGYIQNNSETLGLPEVTILIFSLLAMLFVLGIFMQMWKKLTEPERPQVMYP
jgi:hypothetical protein